MSFSTKKIHGVMCVVLAGFAFVIAAVAIGSYSIPMLIVQALLLSLAVVIISKNYCSKCPCRDDCNHVLFGKVSQMVSKSNSDKYTSADWVSVFIPVLIIIGFPQYWLVKNPVFLITFWVLISLGGLEALLFICPKCLNHKCSLCRNCNIKKP